MKNTFNLMTTSILVFVFNISVAQSESEPIVVNPLIGDTLSLSERDYYQLLPKIEGFQSAVFYLNPDSTLNVKVHYLKDEISIDTLIQNYKSLKSLNYHINARDALENKSYLISYEAKKTNFDRGADVSVFLDEGDVVSGELLSVKNNSLLVVKQECNQISKKSNCTQNINSSEITKLVLEGDSNVVEGIVLGLATAIAASAIIYQSNHTPSSFGPGIDEDTADLMVITTVSCISLGTMIGILTSTPDKVIEPFSENDIVGLSAYARYQSTEPSEQK